MIFAVYKPVGPTSFDVIKQIRKITGIKKVGHAGTLDPLASGVLVVAVGRQSTKKLAQEVKKEKEYLAEIKLGEESTTYDAEGKKKKISVSEIPTIADINQAILKFQGKILQAPPLYSAVKVAGQKAYKMARKGKTIELNPREVEIKKIELLEYSWPYLKLNVTTGPGVYIRSLAHDLGKALKTGGYLSALERTRVGNFAKEQAVVIADLENFLKKNELTK